MYALLDVLFLHRNINNIYKVLLCVCVKSVAIGRALQHLRLTHITEYERKQSSSEDSLPQRLYLNEHAATTLTEQLCAYIFLPPTLCRVWLRIWQLHTMPHLLRAWTHSRKSAAISARPISHVHLSPCLKRSLCLVMLRGSGVFASLLLSLKGKLCWKSSGCQILPACRFQLCR